MQVDTYTLSDASNIMHVTRQAVHNAIRCGRLKAKSKNGKWVITTEALRDYQVTKYRRPKITAGDEVRVSEAADIVGVPTQTIYYAIRSGKLAARKKGCAVVIRKADVIAYANSKNHHIAAIAFI